MFENKTHCQLIRHLVYFESQLNVKEIEKNQRKTVNLCQNEIWSKIQPWVESNISNLA